MKTPDFQIRVLPDDGGPCEIQVTGEIDTATCGRVIEAFDQVCREASEVVMDLGAVTFMDSSGLRALLEVERAAQRSGCALRIAGAEGEVAKLLELTGADKHLPLEEGGEGTPNA